MDIETRRGYATYRILRGEGHAPAPLTLNTEMGRIEASSDTNDHYTLTREELEGVRELFGRCQTPFGAASNSDRWFNFVWTVITGTFFVPSKGGKNTLKQSRVIAAEARACGIATNSPEFQKAMECFSGYFRRPAYRWDITQSEDAFHLLGQMGGVDNGTAGSKRTCFHPGSPSWSDAPLTLAAGNYRHDATFLLRLFNDSGEWLGRAVGVQLRQDVFLLTNHYVRKGFPSSLLFFQQALFAAQGRRLHVRTLSLEERTWLLPIFLNQDTTYLFGADHGSPPITMGNWRMTCPGCEERSVMRGASSGHLHGLCEPCLDYQKDS